MMNPKYPSAIILYFFSNKVLREHCFTFKIFLWRQAEGNKNHREMALAEVKFPPKTS